MKKADLASLDVKGKRVFVRVDYNVPLAAKDGVTRVADDRRIRATLPTLEKILKRGGSVVAASHLGRPKGRKVAEMSLSPCASTLAEISGRRVDLAPDCDGDETVKMARDLRPGSVLLLENLRFHPGEEANDDAFAGRLASLADLYVNDAFGSAHRAHASVAAICGHFERPAAGDLMEKEIRYLSRLLASPDRPYAALLGGAKVGDKLPLIENLLSRVDTLLIGGAMAYTFLRARGIRVGASKVEEDRIDLAGGLFRKAEEAGVQLILPTDHVTGDPESSAPIGVTRDASVEEGQAALDIGPMTAAAFSEEIGRARTILWNGPLGRFEVKGFATGTRRVASAIISATGEGALSVVGGGDSAAALKAMQMEEGFSHISTGGGASLEFLSGRKLPGLEALADAA
jgi:phosphoglycerate kinase